MDALVGQLDEIVGRLAKAGWKERTAIKEELLAFAAGAEDREVVERHLAEARKGIQDLEVRWEIDEVIEALQPEPEPEPEPEEEEPEADDPNKPLSAADLKLVYHDPAGLVLHKSKTGDRWFATQRHPATGQPQTFELHPHEIEQLKTQLRGSPYWVLGSGETP